MSLDLTWLVILAAALGLAAWAVLDRGNFASWLATGACASTAAAAVFVLARLAPRAGLALLYLGFALGLASLLFAVFRPASRTRAALVAAGWAVAVPLALPFLPHPVV